MTIELFEYHHSQPPTKDASMKRRSTTAAIAIGLAKLGTITVDRGDSREGYFGPGATSRCSTAGQVLTDHGHVSRIPLGLVIWQSG
jgi:hypothetical protein